ncbi:restriction endonuclease subunit S [Escherichia coli]|nr:restriction endonuclease subunit S [Escherichia coli]
MQNAHFTKSAMFKNFVKQILGATINQITITDLKRVTLNIPVDIEEQQAIASVLTVIDEEIESLETEKAKIMQIREGAMDDLLTGRVRLKV